MYHFEYQTKKFWYLTYFDVFYPPNILYLCSVDATNDKKIGRLINHSKKSPNLHPRIVSVQKQPKIVFVAAREISVGEELSYDYGERREEALQYFPWLKN